MKSVNELLALFMRQAQLERAAKPLGGARVGEKHELDAVRKNLQRFVTKRSLEVHDNERARNLIPG